MLYKTLTGSTLLLTALAAASPAMATQAGDILARARIINISPDVSSGQILLAGTSTPWPSAGSGIDVDNKVTLDIDFTYFVTDNFGIELLLDISSKHDIQGTGSAAVGKIGEVTVLPPALIAQYHFSPSSNVRPYAGLGINYTFFFSEETTPALTGALAATSSDVAVDDSFGLVAQAGVDIDIDSQWYINLDLKYIALDTTATVKANGATAATVDFDLNPWVIGAGIGMRF
jgi:outer membrane protein